MNDSSPTCAHRDRFVALALRIAVTVAVLVPGGCAPEPVEQGPPPPRAVTAIEQVVRDPARRLRIAGTATAWKRETLSFQVGGRVVWVTEPEKDVQGPSIDEQFLPGRDGAVIARIDPERYENALASARSSLAAAQAMFDATKQQLDEVLPQDEAAAAAELRRARDNRDRIKRAVERNAVAGTELTNAEAAFETATASLASIQARMRAQKTELERLQALVDQADEARQRAELDVRDTTLRAPFAGRITAVEVVPGALVQPGTPVAQLVMMDPIKVDVIVANSTARELAKQDHGLVYTDGDPEPLIAGFYETDSVADSATRTVTVSLIVRNFPSEEPPDDPDLLVIEDTLPLIQFPEDGDRAWFIEKRAVKRDAQGTFAWRIRAEDLRQVTGRPVELERMPIELGESRRDFVGLYQFYEVIPSPEMEPLLERAVAVSIQDLQFALGVPEGFTGGRAMVVRRDRRIRPGEVVDVQLDLDSAGPGIWVPASAIVHTSSDGSGDDAAVLLVIEGGAGGAAQLRRTSVTISGQVGGLVRIADAAIGNGEPIVDAGTHVLVDGERVQVQELRSAR